MVSPPAARGDAWTIKGSIGADALLEVASTIQGAVRSCVEQSDEDRRAMRTPASLSAGPPGSTLPSTIVKDELSEEDDSDEGEEVDNHRPSTTPIRSRWELLKQSNFFLAAPPKDSSGGIEMEAADGGGKEQSDNDYSASSDKDANGGPSSIRADTRQPKLLTVTQARRVPLVIASDDEDEAA